MRPPLVASLLPAVLLVVACGGNSLRDQALESAKAARARGDLVGETLAMRQACAADPKNQKVCAQTAEMDARALAQTKAAAWAACSLVDTQSPQTITVCVDALAPLRKLFPTEPDAIALADRAGTAFASHCGNEPAADLATAIARVRCADAGIEAFATATYAAFARQTRLDAAGAMISLASSMDDRLGARAALLSAAWCVHASEDVRPQLETALRTFAAASAPTLHVRSKGMPAGDLCAATASALGDRLQCTAAADSRSVVLESTVSFGDTDHRTSERTATQRYLAGTDRYENPEYRVRARDELHTRAEARQAEQLYRGEQQACDEADAALTRANYCYDCQPRYDRDSACRRADDAKAMWEARESDWTNAKTTLDNTPAIIEQEDWRDASYVVRDHVWASPWEAQLRALPGQTSHAAGVATYEDSESRGSDVAGVAADPLSAPTGTWYLPQARQQVAATLANLVSTELAARVSTLRGRCPGEAPAWSDPAWLDCYATAILVGGSDASLGETLLRAETAAWDRARGAGFPTLVCR
jgi:hypothetical protein